MSRKNFISLAERNPELLKEWHPIKNEKLKPNEISYGSATKVWWKCENGHEWEASPNHRSRGRGCPYCAQIQRAITKRKNNINKRESLATKNPKLAKEWHPTKNGDFKPTDITCGSSEKVWWKCEKGHEWKAAINSRNSGVGCPICSGYKVVEGVNDLASLRPDLAREWHPTKNGELKPTQVPLHTDTSVWWKCEKGHEWLARISNRANGNNCPICIEKKVLVGYNDLATLMPNLAKEWHPTKNKNLTPQSVTLGSNKKVWWKCEKGHEWETTISHRSNGQKCPICFSESRTSFPEQAIFFYLHQITTAYNRYKVDLRTEIDVYLPEYKIGIEYDGLYFHKGEKSEQREKRKQEKLEKLGIFLIRVRESNDRIKNVIYSKAGATDIELTQTICSLIEMIAQKIGYPISVDVDVSRDRNKIYERYIQGEKEKSLIETNPELAREWHPTKNGNMLPNYVTVGSNKKVWWKCEKGHEWQAVINSRRNGVGCPYCAGKKAIKGYNDLATINPKLAREWHPTKNGNLTPSDITVRSNRFVWWRCEKGHEWQAMVYDRTNGCNCPICSGRKVLIGYNDLATTNSKLASEWHPTKNGDFKATDVTRGSDKKVWWQCEKGHEWQATISSRNSGHGCPYCANQLVLKGYNDLATINPNLAKEWHPIKNGDLTPYDVMPGSNKKVWWFGKCGHEWEAAISSRSSGRGCPYCAGQKLLIGYNDLATSNPKLAKEWHPTKNGSLTPYDVMPGSNKKVWWQCEKGHEWENSVNVRNGGHNCPYCANQLVLKGYNDLATINPNLAKEWHPTKNGNLTPYDVMPGSNKKVWWQCEKGHEWQANISSRNKGAGCAECYKLRRTRKNMKDTTI